MSLDADVPIAGLRLRVGDLVLRHARESDLTTLADRQPDDYEHDPRAERWPGESVIELRRRLVHQDYWTSLGGWTPDDWCLTFVVERAREVVGMQKLEAQRFAHLRTVDSASWLVPAVRGQGLGVRMRRAVLALAFDHLGAEAAVTSARTDNLGSLGVSHRVGYTDNGISLNRGPRGLGELQHLRLTRAAWVESGLGRGIDISGVDACRRWFGLDG